MVAVKVCRGGSSAIDCSESDPLLNWGDDITDALLSSDEVARERGRVEIDTNHVNKLEVVGEIPVMEYIDPESLVQVDDMRGRLLSLSLYANKDTRKTTITIESRL